MAVVDRDSAGIVLQEANEILTTPLAALMLREVNAVVTPAADDSATSIHRFMRVPSNARASQLLISAADASTAGKYDVGLYRTVEDGGALVDVDFFASAFDLSGGPFSNFDITHESGEYTIAETEDPLWLALGLSEDPHIEYDVVGLVETTFNGGPTSVGMKLRYTV